MKLVECDTGIDQKMGVINDSTYTEPKVLHNLDNAMADILYNKNLTDNEKWALYNQILHRYLYFARQSTMATTNTQKTSDTPTIPFNETILSTPVKHFFETARMSNANDLPPLQTLQCPQQLHQSQQLQVDRVNDDDDDIRTHPPGRRSELLGAVDPDINFDPFFDTEIYARRLRKRRGESLNTTLRPTVTPFKQPPKRKPRKHKDRNTPNISDTSMESVNTVREAMLENWIQSSIP